MTSIGLEGYEEFISSATKQLQQPVRRQINRKRFRLYCKCSSEQGWIKASSSGARITKFTCEHCKHFMWTFTKLSKTERGF